MIDKNIKVKPINERIRELEEKIKSLTDNYFKCYDKKTWLMLEIYQEELNYFQEMKELEEEHGVNNE